MIPRHLDPAWRGRFAGEAAAQRDSRARLYPGLIAAGRADRAKVEADWRAWVAIARWCAGEPIGFPIAWADMAAAAERAAAQGGRSAAERPGDPDLARRRAAVEEIARLVAAMQAFIDSINAALRRRAEAA